MVFVCLGFVCFLMFLFCVLLQHIGWLKGNKKKTQNTLLKFTAPMGSEDSG